MATRNSHSTDAPHFNRHNWETDLLNRLRQSTDTLRFSRLAELTGVHPETVRRYMTRGRPSIYFIAALCRALDLSPEWVLFGATDRRSKGSPSAIEPKLAAGTRAAARLSPTES